KARRPRRTLARILEPAHDWLQRPRRRRSRRLIYFWLADAAGTARRVARSASARRDSRRGNGFSRRSPRSPRGPRPPRARIGRATRHHTGERRGKFFGLLSEALPD